MKKLLLILSIGIITLLIFSKSAILFLGIVIGAVGQCLLSKLLRRKKEC